MRSPNISAVILAAGKGSRMKSDQAKVLHELFFKPMLHHVLDTVAATVIDHLAVIIGHQREKVLTSLQEAPSPYAFTPVVQKEQLGTGHAVLCAESACASSDLVMILCGDTPLIRPETLQAMIDRHQEGQAVLTLMTTVLNDPFGYGRIIPDEKGGVLAVVEQKDASEKQRALQEINAGIYLVERNFLFSALQQVGTDNSQGEVYLTDIVSIARRQGGRVEKFVHTPAIDVLGVNSRVELAQAHQELQMRHNREVMLNGVTMYGPEYILLSPDCRIGRDAVLHSGVHITGNSEIGNKVRIAPGAVLHNCQVGDRALIGANAVLSNCTVRQGERIVPLTSRLS